MRLFCLAVATLLIASPANADITVRYALGPPPGAMPAMVIEMNDRGDARMAMGNQAAILVLDGVTYMIQGDLRGVYAARLDDLTALMAERFQAMTHDLNVPSHPATGDTAETMRFVEAGPETVAGRTGTLWTMRTTGNPPMHALDMVISNDPELAPLGRLFARQFGSSTQGLATMMGSTAGAFGTDFLQSFQTLLARGAPLRMGHLMQLESIDTRPVPASEFVLPSAPLTRDQLVERLGWPAAPTPAATSDAH